jgi:hypothetical protein
VRKERVAFEHAGIAVGCFLARATLVDQRDRDAALGKLQRDRGADDARAEHHRLNPGHGRISEMTDPM